MDEVPAWSDPTLLERWYHTRTGGRLERWARADPWQTGPAWPPRSRGCWAVYPPHRRGRVPWGSALNLIGRLTYTEADSSPPFAWAERVIDDLLAETPPA